MKFPEPARQVWHEHEDVLLKYLGHLSADSPRPTAWWIGGETVLAARWQHRQSYDIDILISSKLEESATAETLTDIATELRHRGLEIELDTPNGWLHARYPDQNTPSRQKGIDLWVKEPRLREPTDIEQIETWTLPTLSTSQILYGKLLRDGLQTTRDAYDIARAHTRDAPGLEAAVNSISWNRQRRSEILWRTGSENMDREENAILQPDGTPAADQRECGLRAAKAVHQSRWTELEITARNGRLHARTRTNGGTERKWLGPDGSSAKGSLKRLAGSGIYLHILENYQDRDWRPRDVIDEILRALKEGGSERILHTRTPEAAKLHGPPEARLTAEIAAIETEAGSEPSKIVVRGKGLPVGGKRPGGARSRTQKQDRR